MKTRLILTAAVLFAAALPLRAQTPTPPPTATATPAAGYVAAFQTTATSSLATRQAHTAAVLSQRLTASESQLLMNFRSVYGAVWKNTDGLTPQQVSDALGTRADNLFVIAGTMANALYQIDPNGLGAMVASPAGYTITGNADGTVTITYAPPAATPAPAATAAPTPGS